jgi:hypothetical protein
MKIYTFSQKARPFLLLRTILPVLSNALAFKNVRVKLLLKLFMASFMRLVLTRESSLKGKISTVDLLVLTSSDQLLLC